MTTKDKDLRPYVFRVYNGQPIMVAKRGTLLNLDEPTRELPVEEWLVLGARWTAYEIQYSHSQQCALLAAPLTQTPQLYCIRDDLGRVRARISCVFHSVDTDHASTDDCCMLQTILYSSNQRTVIENKLFSMSDTVEEVLGELMHAITAEPPVFRSQQQINWMLKTA